MSDLLTHVGSVFGRMTLICRERPTERIPGPRPPEGSDLFAWYEAHLAEMLTTLEESPSMTRTIRLSKRIRFTAEYNVATVDDGFLILYPDVYKRMRSKVRDEVEQTLRESDERLRRATDIETVGVLFFDRNGTLIDANASFLKSTGHTRACPEGITRATVLELCAAHGIAQCKAMIAVAETDVGFTYSSA